MGMDSIPRGKLLFALAMVAVLAVALTACGGGSSSSSSAAKKPAAARPRKWPKKRWRWPKNTKK